MVTTQTPPARPMGEAVPAWQSNLASFTICRGVRAGALWGGVIGFCYIGVALFGEFTAVEFARWAPVLGSIAAVVGAMVGVVMGLILGALIGIAADLVRAPARFPSYVAATVGAVAALPLAWTLTRGTIAPDEAPFWITVFTLFPMIMATASYRHAADIRDRYASWQR